MFLYRSSQIFFLCVVVFLLLGGSRAIAWDACYSSAYTTPEARIAAAHPGGVYGGSTVVNSTTVSIRVNNTSGVQVAGFSCWNNSACPAGRVLDTHTGACNCPSGQEMFQGQCVTACGAGESRGYGDSLISIRYAGNPSPTIACRTQAAQCQAQAGGKLNSAHLQNEVSGCETSCTLTVSGNYKYLCTYTGNTGNRCAPGDLNCSAEPGGNTTKPLDSNVAPQTGGGCPPGTSSGTVNGQPYCASSANTNVASSANTGANSNGTNTQVSTTTTQTTTNPDGSTSTTSITTTSGGVGTSLNPGVVKLDPNSTSNVSIKGAGTCDSTTSDYAECIGIQNPGQCVDDPETPENECGTGGGEGECDPTAADYLQCLAGDQSEYDDFGNGEKTLQTVADDFYTGVEQSAIGQLANSISGGLPAGQCPVVNFEMFNRNFTMDFWCQLYNDNGETISTVAHAGWILMGILIILGA